MLETMELLDDPRERRRHDGLVECRQEQRQHDAEHDEQLPRFRDVCEHGSDEGLLRRGGASSRLGSRTARSDNKAKSGATAGAGSW